MNSSGGTREQPSTPETRLGPEHAWLGLAIAALTTAVVGLIVEDQAGVVVFRGAYSVLTGLFVCGCIAWKVEAAERRRRRREQLDGPCTCAALSKELEELREQVEAQRLAAGRHVPEQGSSGRGGRRLRREDEPVNYWTVYTDVMEDLGGLDQPPPSES